MNNDNKTKTFFAVDLGATSGRTITGRLCDGEIVLEELTRFDNNIIRTGGHYYWDIFALYNEIIHGLRKAAGLGYDICSIGIDTWGVDFVCVGSDGAILRNPLSYRDPYTFAAMDDYLAKKASRDYVYSTTGIQFMNFNSLFQLHAMRLGGDSVLAAADKILFVPDCLSYMLTGNAVCEYTIASTSQMLNPRTKDLDPALLSSLDLSRDTFGRMVNPCDIIGTLTPEVQELTGLGAVKVVAVAGHDTASAVAAVPATSKQFAYLSSGTWSLMGIETSEAIIDERSYALNFTNEGGIEGTTRFLKNICGMWLYERCRQEWPSTQHITHGELQATALTCEPFRSLINPDDDMFANPSSMTKAISKYCIDHEEPAPESPAQFCRCIFDSLALRYRQVFGWLSSMADFPISVLHIIGGGSNNKILNQFTANALGVKVLAGPSECTAMGNIMLQAKASGDVSDIWHMRSIINRSVSIEEYSPTDKQLWDAAYAKYIDITTR